VTAWCHVKHPPELRSGGVGCDVIAVIHAYSRTNAGDGLLVDLTLERLARAGARSSDCVLFALDASSFSELPEVRQIGMPGRTPSPRMLGSLVELGAAAAIRATKGAWSLGTMAELDHAAAVVAVGGGYFRTGTVMSAFGSLLNHLPQLAAASVASAPTLYLPQSIGPLHGIVGRWIKTCLRDIDLIWARDDQTVAELAGWATVRRAPDLAVLHIAEARSQLRDADGGPTILVGRPLDSSGGYGQRLASLSRRLPSVLWAVQAEGPGSKNDRVFYRQLGFNPEGHLADVLKKHPRGIVVSVRLHGALQALAAGVPAIHLSYQRKGWAAYADLGLTEFVHDARTFDPATVAAQVLRVRSDPSDLWNRLTSHYDALVETSLELDRSVAATLA
jgi:hypothetical protein